MSLLTPPSSGRRHALKENVAIRGVTWAVSPDVLRFELQSVLPSSPNRSPTRPQAQTLPRPILKKESNYPLLPFEDQDKREETPAPEDPLTSLTYLANPITSILTDTHLPDLTTAYSVLNTRLREHLRDKDGNEVDVDGKWPMFHPIRQNLDAFTRHLERDLARAKADPALTAPKDDDEDVCIDPGSYLPSPQSSPLRPVHNTPKKRGMSASHATHARDMCNLNHAALRMLMTIFQHKALYSLFPERAISDLLTALLAIPLASSLPTPNSRKTYALAVNALSALDCLPSKFLTESVTTRVVFSFQRALDGELGKEGKKGACADALRAIATLSLTYPNIFVDAFEPLLKTILAHLSHITLNMRSLASHAVSAYALATSRVPISDIHRRLASCVCQHMAPSIGKGGVVLKENILSKQIRNAMSNTLAEGHIATRPAFAISTIAALTLLFNTALYIPTDSAPVLKVRQVLRNLCTMPLHSRKPGISLAGTTLMGILTYIAIQPPAFFTLDEDVDITEQMKACVIEARDELWEIPKVHLDNGAGVSFLAALTFTSKGSEIPSLDPESKRKYDMALELSESMMGLSGLGKTLAVQSCRKLLEAPRRKRHQYHPREALLSSGLFAGQDQGGLLSTAEPLVKILREIYREMGSVEHITPLPNSYLRLSETKRSLNMIWLGAVRGFTLPHGDDNRGIDLDDVLGLWRNLVDMRVELTSKTDAEVTVRFLVAQTEFLVNNVLLDETVNIAPSNPPQVTVTTSKRLSKFVCDSYIPPTQPDTLFDDAGERNLNTKLGLVRELWSLNRQIVADNLVPESEPWSKKILRSSAAVLLEHLMRCCNMYSDSKLWAEFVVEVQVELLRGDSSLSHLELFWGFENSEVGDGEAGKKWRDSIVSQWSQTTYFEIWSAFARRWEGMLRENRDDGVLLSRLLEGVRIILTAPFLSVAPDVDETTVEIFGEVLDSSVKLVGTNDLTFIGALAQNLLTNCTLPSSGLLHIMDSMLTHASRLITPLNKEATSIEQILAFIGYGLEKCYPPPSFEREAWIAMIGTLATVIDRCSGSPVVRLVSKGIGIWVGDATKAFKDDDWEQHLSFLWQITLSGLGSIVSPSPERMAIIRPLAEAAFSDQGEQRSQYVQAAFSEMWDDFFAPKGAKIEDFDIPSKWLGIEEPIHMPADSSHLFTPSRSSAISSEPPALSFLAASPFLPGSPSRTPRSRQTPAATPRSQKRRRLFEEDEEKENALVQLSPLFTPVTQRIHALSSSPKKVDNASRSPQKRLHDDMLSRGSPPPKRARVLSNNSSPNGDSIHLYSSDENSDPVAPALHNPAQETPKKRKRASYGPPIPIPGAKEVYGTNLPLSRSLDSSDYIYKTPPHKRIKPAPRKSQSLPKRMKLQSLEDQGYSDTESLHANQPCGDCGKDLPPVLSEPPSDDSIPSPVKSDPPSSDDDPFIGQVTPTHVFSSPTLRRHREAEFGSLSPSPFTLPLSPISKDVDLFQEEKEACLAFPPTKTARKTSRRIVKRKASEMGWR
ncbi:hypothetical protein DL96DRAFT_1817803 [Flagelloscypha sp. PMI_526]|nr:hypothetical protein DL96DRAFT_1817803 [Flagelloscypha sp. PMI_526]